MKKRAHIAPARKAERSAARRNASRARRGAGARTHTLALPGECTLADAETLKLRLAALLKRPSRVTIDMSTVRRIDTASLQLLACFAQERRASGLALETSGDSAVFVEAVRLLGLAELLGCGPRPAPREA